MIGRTIEPRDNLRALFFVGWPGSDSADSLGDTGLARVCATRPINQPRRSLECHACGVYHPAPTKPQSFGRQHGCVPFALDTQAQIPYASSHLKEVIHLVNGQDERYFS